MSTRLRSLLVSFLIIAGNHASAAADRVSVVLSDNSAPYLAAADAFTSLFVNGPTGSTKVEVVLAPALAGANTSPLEDSALVVTVGLAATEAVLREHSDVPVLSTLIPKIAYESLACSASHRLAGRRCSAIYLDQPLERQLKLIQAALPGKRKIGIVFGPSSEKLLPELLEQAPGRNFLLSYQVIHDVSQLYPALETVLAASDVLLTLPDGAVLTSSSARSMLISAYRAQVPVVAFSENYVKAGATLGVFSTPQQQGRQAAEVASAALATGTAGLPSPQYPKYFSVKVNDQVARSLGLSIPDEQTLQQRLAELRR